MKPVPHGEPYAGKLHVRFDEGAGVPDNKGRPALLYTPLQETVDNYLFRRKDLMAILFSRLIAFVECCVAVPANRIGSKTMTLEQGIRYLSREGEVRHHGQTENSRQAADFSRKRSANLKARNRAAAPRTWSGACFREVDGSFQKGTGPFQVRFRLL